MKLKKIRESKNLTQQNMADLLNITVSAYNMYENGNRRIPAKIALSISKLFKVEMDDIFLPQTFTVSK